MSNTALPSLEILDKQDEQKAQDAADEVSVEEQGIVRARLHDSTYDSASLGRTQPYAFYAPSDWQPGDTGTRYPLLVLLHGRTGNFRDWPTHTRLARAAADFPGFIAFPDGGERGYYTNARDGSGDYEDDLIRDFLPYLQNTLPLVPPGRRWAIGGLSMGGYGAVKIALKHHVLFSLAWSSSGAFEPFRQPEYAGIFGTPPEDSAHIRANNPYSLVEDALSRWPQERPRLWLDCGTEDFLLETNRRLHRQLNFLGYPHEYRESPGYHTWPYWDRQMRLTLPRIAAHLEGARDRE